MTKIIIEIKTILLIVFCFLLFQTSSARSSDEIIKSQVNKFLLKDCITSLDVESEKVKNISFLKINNCEAYVISQKFLGVDEILYSLANYYNDNNKTHLYIYYLTISANHGFTPSYLELGHSLRKNKLGLSIYWYKKYIKEVTNTKEKIYGHKLLIDAYLEETGNPFSYSSAYAWTLFCNKEFNNACMVRLQQINNRISKDQKKIGKSFFNQMQNQQ